MVRALVVALLLLRALPSAAIGGGAVGEPSGLRITTNDVSQSDDARTLELPSASFSVNCDAGTCEADLGPNVSLLGSVAGDTANEVVFFDGDATAQTCGTGNEGKHRVLDTGALQYCDGATATRRDVAVASGLPGGQTITGGTAAGDGLVLRGTAATKDTSTGQWAGAKLQLGATNSAEVTYLTEGTQSLSGIYVPAIFTGPGDTWTMSTATCTNIGGEDASWCLGADFPQDCCTGAGTGQCGYCSGTGTGVPVPCGDGSGGAGIQCLAAVQYLSQWWHPIDFAVNGNAVESFATQTWVPMLMGSGGGTRSIGLTGFADYGPTFYLRDNATNIAAGEAGGLNFGPAFRRQAGTQTGTVAGITALNARAFIDTGWTATDYKGVAVANPTGAGTLTNAYGIDVADLTKAGTLAAAFNTAMSSSGSTRFALRSTGSAPSVHAGRVRMGDTTAPSHQLDLTAAVSATVNPLNIDVTGATLDDQTGIDLFPAGASIGSDSTNETFRGVRFKGLLTQSTNAAGFLYPGIYLFDDTHTFKLSDSALSASVIGGNVSFGARSTIENATDDNVTNYVNNGVSFIPTYVKSGSGTLTINNEAGLWSQPATIPSGVTVANSFAVRAQSPTATGTLTNAHGFYAEITTGTNRMPYAAKEGAVTGSNPANTGAWGVDDNSPNRFYYRNESGHVWRMGYLTMTATGTGLATTATTKYFSGQGISASNATEASITAVPGPGALKVYAMSCGLGVAAGAGTDAHAITLRAAVDGGAAADTAVTCTITTSAKNCQYRNESGTAIAAANALTFKDVTADTPTANSVTCVLVYNLDVW
jgi:hypothetical protein